MENKKINSNLSVKFKYKCGFYEKYAKRFTDIVCSLVAIFAFSWLYIIVAILVRIKLGTPILFKQPRPGKISPKTGKEKIFYMYKFRSMSNEKDENGDLLPDDIRLGYFGKALRETSLDELPEVFNILKGDMSIIGPRPQLVRDMVFMTDEQRMRHIVRPGLSGLAQVRGRNALEWKDKLASDLEYIQNITFIGDIKIIVTTVKQVFLHKKKRSDSDVNEIDITDDYGDYLLKKGLITENEYKIKQKEAKKLLRAE